MKLAVVADIHGNVLALEAVLADLKCEAPDTVVNLGDCASGPLWPEETAAVLRETNWPTVRGNHDRVIAAGNIPPENRTDSFTIAHLSTESLTWIQGLPPVIQLSDDILLCHGTPDSDVSYLTENVIGDSLHRADLDTIRSRLLGNDTPLICSGHTHIQRLITLTASRQTIINPGSVGLPGYSDDTPVLHKAEAGSPHARYALIEQTSDGWQIEMRALTYDWEAAAAEAERNGRPDWATPLRSGFFGQLL
ncbi:metallophosphoesterase family protein [Roseibium algae]|uniref:Metallophosphoesterase family protein n=1 Tax=Roseibium algae TaxID=3123038 RepID=A0ABU8TP60_9HYPH